MSFLIQRHKFGHYWRYVQLVNLKNTRKLRVTSQTNLFVSKCSYKPSPVLNIANDRIRNYLNYLTNEYENNTWQSNRLLDFIDLYVISDLMNKRVFALKNLQALQELARQDLEMKKLAKEEEVVLEEQLNQLDKKLLDIILANICKEYYQSIIIEITAGVGGREAMLFVNDLYKMYIGYAKYLSLSYEVLDMESTDINGIRNVSIVLSGKSISKLMHEGGVHRVQRIPATENSGRIHTSTVSVAILPLVSEMEIAIKEKDLKIATMRASGAGGQHVNTTNSAIRITHLPTGLVVNCQVHRSQIKNRQMAMMKLRSMLYERQLKEQTTFTSELRKKQMGMGLRNEKIRTYNYNQDRITDHRLKNGTVYNLEEFMQGGAALEALEDELQNDMRTRTLLEIVRKLESQLK